MIQVEENVFTILQEGIRTQHNKDGGFVELEARVSEGRNCALEILVANETIFESGDYLPLDLTETELTEFIEFLNKQLTKVKERSKR